MKNDRLIDLGLTGYEELFMSTEERLDAKKPRVEAIPLAVLTPFRNHPFKMKEDEEMAQLMRNLPLPQAHLVVRIEKTEEEEYNSRKNSR